MKPVFVKIERFKEVEDTIGLIKSRIHEAKNLLEKIHSIKEEEQKELDAVRHDIHQVEDKIALAERALTK